MYRLKKYTHYLLSISLAKPLMYKFYVVVKKGKAHFNYITHLLIKMTTISNIKAQHF